MICNLYDIMWRSLGQDALAVGGEFGILEGRTFALIHPIVMGSLFVYTLWAGYLGWQWRRVRTIQTEINELKKQVKPVAVAPDGSAPPETPPSPVELQIQQLTEVCLSSIHSMDSLPTISYAAFHEMLGYPEYMFT